jgi:methylenetetrahydrofolate dehydrogenase (NADP+)/methenyltetrahydrofolate cyclohydrolase
MILLDGRKISSEIKEEIKKEVAHMLASGKRAPHLAAILVGTNGASEAYVANKVKSCNEVGFSSSLFRFDDSVSEKTLLEKIEEVNGNPLIDGLIVQLPLPHHIQVRKVTEAIYPSKDVDGFHPVNAGRMMQNIPGYIPATPMGILMMLERSQIQTEGKRCVVLGRSNIVGMPMSILMGRNGYPGNCTVTLCHSKTKNLESVTREADILIAALGKPQFVRGDMVKEGAVVVDVGITRLESSLTKSGYKLFGDVNFDEVSQKAGYLTPVPGGVGLMTIAGLLKNTLSAARRDFTY